MEERIRNRRLTPDEQKQEAKKLRKRKIKRTLGILFSRKSVCIGLAGVLIFLLIAVFAWVSPYDPNKTNAREIFVAPSSAHWLGTDNYGRDVLTRIAYGARVSLLVGVLAVFLACIVGVTLGLIAAYFGGWVDAVIMRIMETLMAIPRIMLSLALVTVIGRTITDLAIVLAIGTIPMYVRIVRGMTLRAKNSDYVKSVEIQGGKSFYVMFRHILPNVISPVIVMMMQNVGSTILMEAGLSYLGVGVEIPIASWGTMVAQGRTYLLAHPLLSIAPGGCVALLVIFMNLFGDGVRDALDPRLRGEV